MTRVLGEASDPAGKLASVEVDYEDTAPNRLLTVRVVNPTAVDVAVTATQVSNGRSASRTFGPGTTAFNLPTGVAGRLTVNGWRRGLFDGVTVDVRMPA